MVRELPPGFGVLLRGALAPVIVKLPMGWRDKSYKRAKRRGAAIATWAVHEAITSSPEPELGGAS
jgi:hypothetical protein